MKNEQDKIIKAREFCQKVKELANEYGLSFFVVTDIKWELENGSDPYEDWGKDKGVDPNE